jgi:hypothetical protein
MVPRCSTDTTYAIYEFKVIYLFIYFEFFICG